MKYGLSPKQNKVLDFIKSYMKDKPVAPTIRNNGSYGFKSKNSVHRILKI